MFSEKIKKLSLAKILAKGFIVLVIGAILWIPLYNIFINKVPVPGLEKQLPFDRNCTYNNTLHYLSKVDPDDPVWHEVISENQASGYAWAFFQNRCNITVFLPLERGQTGLHRMNDGQGNEYVVWSFYVMQIAQGPGNLFGGIYRRGSLWIDAHSGTILSFIELG
jgi:hypothetical protein